MHDLILQIENRMKAMNLLLKFLIKQVSYIYNTYIPQISLLNLIINPSFCARRAARGGG